MKALKGIGATLAVLVLLAAVAFLAAAWLGERKMARTVEVKVVPVPFASDAATLKRGRYLFESRGCAECHAADGHGLAFLDDPSGLYVKSPDITPSRLGVAARYSEADWVRALRHGIDPDGRPLLMMPSDDYSRMSDADLAAIVSYARSLAPASGERAEIRMPMMLKALYGVGWVKDPAEKIDHRLAPSPALVPEASAQYGDYMAQMCRGCHRADLSGGPIAGAPPDWPAASRLAPGPASVMTRYDSLAKFAAMLRDGKRPDGTAVSPAMPFATLRNLDETEVAALYAFLAGGATRVSFSPPKGRAS
jgi:mono/diheme cytochrome c family protein